MTLIRSVISSIVKEQLGDLTFQEAYEKTHRVLNVIIPFEGGKRPVLMNFLTTPNVVCFGFMAMVNIRSSGPLPSPVIHRGAFRAYGAMLGSFVRMKMEGSFPGTQMVNLHLDRALIMSWTRRLYFPTH
jgi:hypothetical protein